MVDERRDGHSALHASGGVLLKQDPHPASAKRCVMQSWLFDLPLMQQTVLLTAVRGPDGLPKYGGVKMLLRWYRRCVLLCALENCAITDPVDKRGGSFTGPSGTPFPGQEDKWEEMMEHSVRDYLRELDAIPHHFQLHFLHAAEIVGYKHPDHRIKLWWFALYARLVMDMHLCVELESELDERLSDDETKWRARADIATQA